MPTSLVPVILLLVLILSFSSCIEIDALEENFFRNPSFDNVITLSMQEGHIPSLVASVIYDDEIVWAKGYGEQSDLDTIFLIGSITKSITATAILQLYEQGLVNLDDDINEYLPFSIRNPYWPNDPITVRMLLSHRASLDDWTTSTCTNVIVNQLYNQSSLFHEHYNHNGFPPYPLWLKEYFLPKGSLYNSSNWASWQPGTSFYYSNCGYVLLSYIIEQISNQTLEEYFCDQIFNPLNMSNTHLHLSNFSEEANLAVGHIWLPDENINSPFPQYDWGGQGCGALHSTAIDLSKFLIFQMNGSYKGVQLLLKETIDLMHSNQGVNEYSYFHRGEYGLGWMIEEWEISNGSESLKLQVNGHGGNIAYFWAGMRYTHQKFDNGTLRDKGIGLVLLVNQGYNANKEECNFPDIFEFIIQEVYKSVDRKRKVYFNSTDTMSTFLNIPGFMFIMNLITLTIIIHRRKG